jgi:hypothetical protein
MRTINIDGVPREIRFYGDTAVVMLAWDDPREIGFQGGARTVTFDDRESVLCSLNDSYRECIIDGITHRLVFNIFSITFFNVFVIASVVSHAVWLQYQTHFCTMYCRQFKNQIETCKTHTIM